MIWLHGNSGFELYNPIPDEELKSLLGSARALLQSRREEQASELLASIPFAVHAATNDFNDDFYVLYACLPLLSYERLGSFAKTDAGRHALQAIAEVISEIGVYIRVIACQLDRAAASSPAVIVASAVLRGLDSDQVYQSWLKAQARCQTDPEGAITLARSLLESVCKHILGDRGVHYDDAADLPKLYRQTSEILRLAPTQHSEDVFKRILGGCTSVVEGLGSLRNRLGDAHGKGPRPSRPRSRHAELALNLAGSMAAFLIATWESQKK